ncbi:MAG: hypothetical protein V3R73_06665, partial [Sphingomonadales bacterium]
AINLSGQFDMSANTALAIQFTDPKGLVKPNVVPTLNESVVTVPDEVIDEATGLAMADFPANESVLYTSLAGEFDVVGTWLAVIIYTNGAQVLRSNPILVNVGE